MLLAVSVAMWALSYLVTFYRHLGTRDGFGYGLTSANGTIGLARHSVPVYDGPRSGAPTDGWSWFGFSAGTERFPGGKVEREFSVPWWFVTACLAVPPARSAARERRRLRLVTKHCGGCGYDLRGAGGRCPECGAEAGAGNPSAGG